MTDTNFCCLCASDEGVFLDIFTATDRQLGNRSFLKEFETCLSVKVIRDEALSSRICHRCAIELGQCNKFVEKYHRVYEATLKLKKSELKKSCSLCLSTAKNSCFFTLAKDFRSKIDPLQKIYECFNRQITREEAESRSICLLCRYNLDVLYDLRKLAGEVNVKLQRIAESKAILANLPKTKTFVVNRKTTVICQSKVELETFSDSDSESDTMARKRSKSKKLGNQQSPVELKLRTCGQCNTSIESGIDMYRLHSTGITVCKMCWITMDPFNPSAASKRKRQNKTEAKNTRLCTVFLTDVLSPASSKDNGSSKVEKEEKKDPIYVISDDSSDGEEKLAARSKRNPQNQRRLEAVGSSKEADNKSRLRLKRGIKNDEGSGDGGAKKKLKSSKIEATTVSSPLRRSARYQSSDSESAKARNKQSSGNASDEKNAVVNKAKNLEKDRLNDRFGDKTSKLKQNKNESRRKGADAETVDSKSEDSGSSGNGEVGIKLRKVRNKVTLNLKPELTDSPKSEKNPKRPEPRTPAPSESSTAISKNSKTKLSPKRSRTLLMVSFPFKLKDPYECKVCRTEYKNKLIGMKHELTHFKQVEIKIKKLNVNHHFQTIDQNSPTTELPDATCSIDLPSTNEKPLQSEVPSSTSPSGTDEDQGKEPDDQTEDGESLRQSKRSESIQRENKSPDIAGAKEADAVSSSNGPQAEESASQISDSIEKTAENVAPELPTETDNGIQKVDTSTVEADSVTETNVTDGNGESVKVSDENRKEELTEDLEKAVENVEEKENGVEDKSDQGVVTLSPKSTSSKAKKLERDRDLGEEIESDTDIRMVDSGSSAEDCSERKEKTKIENSDSTKRDEETKPTDAKEESEPSDEIKLKDSVSTEELEAEVTSTISTENNLDVRNESNDVSSQNDKESVKELSQKIEDEVRPPTAVTEILQEVIDLATAEVQKRVESEIVSVPETLENISEEIKKTAEGSITADEILASFEAAANKEAESYKLDLNTTTSSLKNHLDMGTMDV